MLGVVDLDIPIEKSDSVRLGLLVKDVSQTDDRRDPLVARVALSRLGLFKGEQVIYVDDTLVTDLEL